MDGPLSVNFSVRLGQVFLEPGGLMLKKCQPQFSFEALDYGRGVSGARLSCSFTLRLPCGQTANQQQHGKQP
jgi:hypothetical protein